MANLPFLVLSNEYETAPQSNTFFFETDEKDGWITHRGIGMPVDELVSVLIRRRDGTVKYYHYAYKPAGWRHQIYASALDIMAYKIVE